MANTSNNQSKSNIASISKVLRSTSPREKKCFFCENNIKHIDYKYLPHLRPYINYFGKIKSRYYTGICLKHQKRLASSIKKARIIALLPFYR